MKTFVTWMLISLFLVVPAAVFAGQHHAGGQMGAAGGQQGQMGGMGGGMMGQEMMGGMCPMMMGGMSSDPKIQAAQLKMKGEMLQKMGEIMQKYASELAGAK